MRIHLASIEIGNRTQPIQTAVGDMLWNLSSYWYLRKTPKVWPVIQEHSESVLIDSGAHTFQRSTTRTDFEGYTEEYADWIRKNDVPNVVGFFEMDIDRVVGYEEVLRLRKILHNATDKIIPVWHKNRGVDDYRRMVQEYSGKWVAVTGFKNEDITDEQYWLFIKEAWQYNTRVHGLGMTRMDILDRVPFDSVDSSSWSTGLTYYNLRKLRKQLKLKKTAVKSDWKAAFVMAYRNAMATQRHYYARWKWLHQHEPADRLELIDSLKEAS
nr:hypothetical protein 3 [Spirochaetaceae bacterium]